jgi:hypothetical protein
MNTPDQYKDEAVRLLDHYPLDVCKRVADRLTGCGWELNHFSVDVKVYESIKWTAKARIKTTVTTRTLQEKQRELFAIFERMELSPRLYKAGVHTQVETITHRKYDFCDATQHRSLRGHWYEFNLEFEPATSLELSVLTEEEI